MRLNIVEHEKFRDIRKNIVDSIFIKKRFPGQPFENVVFYRPTSKFHLRTNYIAARRMSHY